jgi:hypothetical protein
MTYFQTKNTNSGSFLEGLAMVMFVWPFSLHIIRPFGICCSLYILLLFGTFFHFGKLFEGKSGNPARRARFPIGISFQQQQAPDPIRLSSC